MSYTKLNPKNGETQVNDTTMKHLDDGIYDIDQNKIDKSTIELLTVDSTAPEHCNTGDMYYNTTTNYIYTATATDTWDTTGELPSSKYLYVDLTNSKLYYYDGTTFTSYGGGSSVEVDTEMSDTSENAVQNKVIKEYVDDQIKIGDTEPTSTINKIWIDTGEIGSAVSEITNEYSTSTGLGYSANYVNNLHTYSTDEIRVGTWLGKPLYRKVIQTTIPTSGNNQNVSFQNNVAIMKSVTGFALQSASGGVNLIIPYISITNSWSIYAYYNRANQELVIENSGTLFMNNTICYLIAEYTKTTD